MKTKLFTLVFLLSISQLFAQHPSAISEFESSDKGILIPRTDTASIITPTATGLLIYQDSDDTFYYYDGSKWAAIAGSGASNSATSEITDNDSDTYIKVEKSTDSDTIHLSTSGLSQMALTNKNLHLDYGLGSLFIGDQTGITDDGTNNRNTAIGSEAMSYNVTGIFNVAVGRKALHNNTNSNNVAIGNRALRDNTAGYGNTGIGMEALLKNIGGDNNVAVGRSTLAYNTTANHNTAIGAYAMRDNTSGAWNTAIGWRASYYNVSGGTNVSMGVKAHEENVSGDNNTSLGAFALQRNKKDNNVSIGFNSLSFNINGQNNVAIGKDSGANSSGSSNVFIGFESGKTETGSNKLFIENSDSSDPLIYGEFDNDLLRINGDFEVSNSSNLVVSTSYNSTEGYGKLTVEDIIKIKPRSLPPTTPDKGEIYYDSDDDLIYYWNGTNWVSL